VATPHIRRLFCNYKGKKAKIQGFSVVWRLCAVLPRVDSAGYTVLIKIAAQLRYRPLQDLANILPHSGYD
jgi:hypothetical protein